ncbi:MAG: hypothetical protein WBP72_07600, partial [Rhodocyclaceae bacterium]
MADLFSLAGKTGPLSTAADSVARAMALLWTFRPRTTILNLLKGMGARRGDGRAFTQEDVRVALEELRERDLLVQLPQRDNHVRLRDDLRARLYRELLQDPGPEALKTALYQLESFRPERGYIFYWPIYDAAATTGLVRLALLSGTPAHDMKQIADAIGRSMDWGEIIIEAALMAFDGPTFELTRPAWLWDLLFHAATELSDSWRADLVPACDWALAQAESRRDSVPEYLRLALAELRLHRGEPEQARYLIDGLDSGAADAMRAALLVQAGRWPEGQVAFEAALKRRGEEVGARKRVLPTSLAWLYPLALLAQGSPKHLETARKFCTGEAGKRNPSQYELWGLWVHAISVRLGDIGLAEGAVLHVPPLAYAQLDHLWSLLLAAWLGRDKVAPVAGKAKFDARLSAYVGALKPHLEGCGLHFLVSQAEAAHCVLLGQEPAQPFFASASAEPWRDVLAALQSLGTEKAEAGKGTAATRIVWVIQLGKKGVLEGIEAHEQKRGPRGWSKPKPLSLSKVAGNEKLAPWDAKVARTLRQDRAYARRYLVDLPAAIVALVGHPAVALA